MKTRAQYIRFSTGVTTPGRAGSPITKAVVPSETAKATTPPNEVMLEILVEGDWVTLSAARKRPTGEPYIARRIVHASHVVDFEPLELVAKTEEEEVAPEEGQKEPAHEAADQGQRHHRQPAEVHPRAHRR